VAIGDVTLDEAGSASGSFSAVRQLASAIGAAVVASIYFKVSAADGGVTAMTVAWCGCCPARLRKGER
jgi:hypothetical protein